MNTGHAGTVVAMIALGIGVACVGQEVPSETARSSTSVGGRELRLQPGTTLGWPGGLDYSGVTHITYQDDHIVRARSDVIIFANPGSVIDLNATQSGLGQRMKTNLGLIVLHRPKGSRGQWVPFTCGDAEGDELPNNGRIGYFKPRAMIDIWYGEVQTEHGRIDIRDCGVTERSPEIAAFVFARSNWLNMRGDYNYKLEATCDDGLECPEDAMRYDPALIALDGTQNWGSAGRGGSRNDCFNDSRCSGGSSNGREICSDGLDNDRDGQFDCDDRDCSNDARCWAGGRGYRAEVCDDRYDNDGDGRFDCDDSDCFGDRRCGGARGGSREVCDDGRDNDRDGQFDCNDSDCSVDARCEHGWNDAYDSGSYDEVPCDCHMDWECVTWTNEWDCWCETECLGE